MPQDQPNVTVTPIPDITLVSNGQDKDIINLEAMAKLEKDLVDAKVQNEGTAQKKQEWANCQAVAKEKKEDEEAVCYIL